MFPQNNPEEVGKTLIEAGPSVVAGGIYSNYVRKNIDHDMSMSRISASLLRVCLIPSLKRIRRSWDK